MQAVLTVFNQTSTIIGAGNTQDREHGRARDSDIATQLDGQFTGGNCVAKR